MGCGWASLAFLWAGNFFIHKAMQPAILMAPGALLLSDGPDQAAPSEEDSP